MKLSITIPAYNEEALIGACLEAIIRSLAASKLASSDYEIVVVNNASTDRTKEVAASYAGVRVVDEPHKGLTRARQTGQNSTRGELVAHIDADTRMPVGWIRMALREFEKYPNMVALTGPYIYYDLSPLKGLLIKIFYVFGFIAHYINQYVFSVGATLQGGNFILRRTALEAIAGFDTSIEFYGEDSDIGKRISKVGDVVWTWKLFMYSSGRRIAKEGIVTIGMTYALNYFSIIFSGKPATVEYSDHRD